MKKVIIIFVSLFISGVCLFANEYNLKKGGVSVDYTDEYGNVKNYTIQRQPDSVCSKVNGGDPDNIWGGNYAKEDLPEACKKTFLTTMGKLTPIQIAEGIKTYGELEVIDFIQKSTKDTSMLLIDARTYDWYKKGNHFFHPFGKIGRSIDGHDFYQIW